MSESLNTQLANAVARVARENDNLLHLRDRTAEAQRNEEAARVRVNEAQRHFDELVAKVKESAPRQTDWELRGFGFVINRPIGPPSLPL